MSPSRDCFREPRDRVRHGRPEHDLVVVVDTADHYPFDKGWCLVSHPSTQLSWNDLVPVPVDDGHRHLAVGQMRLKVSSLVAGMLAGADSIDDMGLLRHGDGPGVHRDVAPSTVVPPSDL
jgi:hypothetical protein